MAGNPGAAHRDNPCEGRQRMVTYNGAISACEKKQQRQVALGLLAEMTLAKVNTLSYIAAIQCVREQIAVSDCLGAAGRDDPCQGGQDCDQFQFCH